MVSNVFFLEGSSPNFMQRYEKTYGRDENRAVPRCLMAAQLISAGDMTGESTLQHCMSQGQIQDLHQVFRTLELNYLSTCRFEYFTALNISRIWILDSFEYFTVLYKSVFHWLRIKSQDLRNWFLYKVNFWKLIFYRKSVSERWLFMKSLFLKIDFSEKVNFWK